jgi:Cu2+-exporting ATPase
MLDQPVAEEVRPGIDVEILLPDKGVIRVASRALFAEPDGALCRRFVERAFAASEIEAVVIAGPLKAANDKPVVELRFDARRYSQRQVIEHIAALLDVAPGSDDAVALPSACTARDGYGVVRYHRYGPRITGWQVLSERIGAIKLSNPVLYRRAALCEAIERELISVLGVDR